MNVLVSFMFAQLALLDLQNDKGQQAADAEYYRQALHDLIGMETDLARLLHMQATGPAQAAQPGAAPRPAPENLVAIASAFDRAARATRRCIALPAA